MPASRHSSNMEGFPVLAAVPEDHHDHQPPQDASAPVLLRRHSAAPDSTVLVDGEQEVKSGDGVQVARL